MNHHENGAKKLYPIVVRLHDRICSFVGGGNLIYSKIREILPYNPKIFIFAEGIIEPLEKIVVNNKHIIWKKNINYEILLKSYLIFVSTEKIQLGDREISPVSQREIENILKFSKRYSKLISFLDNNQLCDFFSTHIFEKGPILIGVSTYGNAPMVGKYLTNKLLDSVVDDDLVILANFLSRFRSKIISQIPDKEKRKQFYEKLFQPSFLRILRGSEEEAIGELLRLLVEHSR